MDDKKTLGVLLVAGSLLLLLGKKGKGGLRRLQSVEQWRNLISSQFKSGVNSIILPDTMMAVIHQQSQGKTELVRGTAYGLTQIDCASALSYGLMTCKRLLNPATNIQYAQQVLSAAAKAAGAMLDPTVIAARGDKIIEGIGNYYGLSAAQKSGNWINYGNYMAS